MSEIHIALRIDEAEFISMQNQAKKIDRLLDDLFSCKRYVNPFLDKM